MKTTPILVFMLSISSLSAFSQTNPFVGDWYMYETEEGIPFKGYFVLFQTHQMLLYSGQKQKR